MSIDEPSSTAPHHAPAPLSQTSTAPTPSSPLAKSTPAPREIGGRDGPDPTRFGDWELKGRCIDF